MRKIPTSSPLGVGGRCALDSPAAFGLNACVRRLPVMNENTDNIQLTAVEDHGGILTSRGGGARGDGNGIHYKQGMSAKNVGTTKLSANIATIPPGGVAYAHIHVDFELILYILEGRVRHEFGEGCKQVLENEAGDFIYIKSDVPHEVFNMSDTEPVVAFVARSSADEWDNIIPYQRKSTVPDEGVSVDSHSAPSPRPAVISTEQIRQFFPALARTHN